MSRARLLLTASFVLGCRAEAPAPVAASDPAHGDTLLASIVDAQRRMHVRYTAARSMVEAIGLSDLDTAHASAVVLAQTTEPAALGTWQPYFRAIERAAREVQSAGNLGAAATAAAQLGASCASCHAAIKAHVRFTDAPRPMEQRHLASQMRGHQWAMTQMWEGLIGPSDERWLAGAQALLEMPIGVVAQSGITMFNDDIDDVARVRLYGRRGLAAASSARAGVFGDLLASCAHCHAVLRDR